jgi:acyl-coenzyme A synthetase/AMP-(fatty) acid ligase
MADLGWAKAAYSTFGNFNLGGTLLVQPPPAGNFTPTHLLEALHRFPVTSLCAPPTIYRTLVTTASLKYIESHPFKALEHCVSAGEPLNASVIHEWRAATGVTIKDAWGQSETVIMVGNFQGEEVSAINHVVSFAEMLTDRFDRSEKAAWASSHLMPSSPSSIAKGKSYLMARKGS